MLYLKYLKCTLYASIEYETANQFRVKSSRIETHKIVYYKLRNGIISNKILQASALFNICLGFF